MKKRITETISIPEFQQAIDSMPLESKIFIDKSMSIADRICNELKKQGLTQREFAVKMGKYESEISRMVSGTHNITLRMIAKAEAVLGVDIIAIN